MAGDVVAALFDSDFGISDGDSSRKEDEEDIYADMGNATIERWRLRKETRHLAVEKNASSAMLQDTQDIK